MDLSAKMPAIQDAKQEPRMDATMRSEAPATGGGGPMMAPQSAMSQKTDPTITYDTINEGSPSDWMNSDKKTGNEWEATDRKEGE